jgi:hypothetical protein
MPTDPFPFRPERRGPLPFLTAALVSLSALAGCLTSERDGRSADRGAAADGAQARLFLRTAALAGSASASPAPDIDSISIRVAGDGMDPREFAFVDGALELDLAGIPPGNARVVSAALFRQGRLLYKGESTADFSRETRADVSLRCEPQFSRVTARFHLPPSLPQPVADGWLVLSGDAGEFRARLERKGEFGSFRVDEVPGNARYGVTLTLLGSDGRTLYDARREDVLLPLGQEVAWDLPLLPVDAMAGLVLQLPEPRQAVVVASFPASSRVPSAAGEIVVTEFYAAPSAADSGSEGEWWELFNRTQDTLALQGCRFARGRGTGATQSFPFDSTHRIPPGKARTFGRYASPVDFRYADFSLVNTASPLLLLCANDGLVVDSLRYSSTVSDSTAVLMREGWVNSLDADSLARGVSRPAWCLTVTAGPVSGPGGAGTASPGDVTDCL